MCTNAAGVFDRGVQAPGSSLVIAFIFSVKWEAWSSAEHDDGLLGKEKQRIIS